MTRDAAITAMEKAYTALHEIACLRLATAEGTLRVRADKIWEIADRSSQELADTLSALGPEKPQALAHELNAWRELGEEMGRIVSCMSQDIKDDLLPDWFGPRLFDLQVKGAALGGRPEHDGRLYVEEIGDARIKVGGQVYVYEHARSGRPETGWQPIATAPKDGTRILVYQPDGQWKRSRGSMTRSGEAVQLVYWHQPGNPERAGYWMPLCRPTHWQPLPSPPLQEQP